MIKLKFISLRGGKICWVFLDILITIKMKLNREITILRINGDEKVVQSPRKKLRIDILWILWYEYFIIAKYWE